MSNRKSVTDFSLNSLESPQINCPSPVVIFQNGSNSFKPAQYQSPIPLQTPRIVNDESEAAACLDVILDIRKELSQRFKRFEENILNRNDEMQMSSS